MVRFEVHELLFVRHFLQAGQFPLLVVDLVLHELLDRADIVLNNVFIGMNVS